MKTTIKRENVEFFVITPRHISGLTGHANPPGTPKMWASSGITSHANRHATPKPWAIAHKNNHKMRKWQFFVITLKHVSVLTGHAKCLGTAKPWAIAHENGHKTQKRRIFGYTSQIWIGSSRPYKSPRNPKNVGKFESYETWKSPWNPKSVGNSSWKRPKNTKITSFWS